MACIFNRLTARSLKAHFLIALCLLFTLTCFIHETYAQIVTSDNTSISFGTIDFADTHNGNIQLGTDGQVNATGYGLSARNNGNAGSIKITEPNTGIIDVKCASSAQLIDSVAPSLDIQNIEIAINTGVSFGNGIACQGLLPANPVTTTIDMDALPDPDILVGGEVVINNISPLPTDRVYSTSGGGSAIRLSITIQ